MELFDLTKAMFQSPGKYAEATKGDKRKNFFMIQRRMAINFPIQAHLLQHIKINMEASVDWWQRYIRKQYTFTPKWMYIQGVKKNQEKEEKRIKISSETVLEYCRFYQKDPKQVKEAIKFYPENMVKEMNDFEKMMKEFK